MQDFTNLGWPETPFGADQRPYGRRAHVLAGFDVTWAWRGDMAEPQPVCVSVVYLRVNPARPLTIEPVTLPVGFWAAVAETHADLDLLLDVFDRALVRARRHAYLLAGHQLDDHLTRIDLLSTGGHPGIEAVLDDWDGRDNKVRGTARLHDTADDPHDLHGEPVDAGLEAASVAEPTSAKATATESLVRCLAIALTAGQRSNLLRWEGVFATSQALAVAGWDILDIPTKAHPG